MLICRDDQNRLLDTALAFGLQLQLAYCDLDIIVYTLIYITGMLSLPWSSCQHDVSRYIL